MIATVTMNPAVDYTVQLEEPLQFNAVNRTENEQITAGGKGINVSLILQQLEIPTTVYGYLSGTTGTMISERIQRTQIPMDFITLPNQMNRINVKFKQHNQVTELNGRGLSVSENDTKALLEKLSKYGSGDYIVLAGSIPAGAAATHYADVMAALADNGVRFAVDAAGNVKDAAAEKVNEAKDAAAEKVNEAKDKAGAAIDNAASDAKKKLGL